MSIMQYRLLRYQNIFRFGNLCHFGTINPIKFLNIETIKEKHIIFHLYTSIFFLKMYNIILIPFH